MHITCRCVEAVLEVDEEEPGGVTKTLHGRGDPHRERRHGDSLGRRCTGTAKMTTYSDAATQGGQRS
jgi:hypothetical protein